MASVVQILRRVLRVFAFVLATVTFVAALAWIVEDWRGARAWSVVRNQLRAQGEHLDWSYFLPNPVPDDQNLALAPLFVRELGDLPDPRTGLLHYTVRPPYETDDLAEMPYGPPGPRAPYSRPFLSGWSPAAHPADWTALQEWFRRKPGFPHPERPGVPVEDVLLALTRYQAVLDELARTAETRPLTYFSVARNQSYPSQFAFPYYGFAQSLASTLCLRASTEVELGRSPDALRDVELALRLYQGFASNPTLESHWGGATVVGIILSPVWRGLAERRWSADELFRLQTDLAQIDLLAGNLRAMRAERADRLTTMARVLAQPGRSPDASGYELGNPMRETVALARQVPSGWVDQNQAFLSRMEQCYLLEVVDPVAHRVFPGPARNIEKQVTDSGWIYGYLAHPFAHLFDYSAMDAARSQTGVDQARTACALERCFLDRGVYPATLSELVPTYLERVPNDIIDGALLRYVAAGDGRYRLYSVGWDSRDEGGRVAWDGQGHYQDYFEGDWTWQYEPFQPPPSTQRSK